MESDALVLHLHNSRKFGVVMWCLFGLLLHDGMLETTQALW